MQINRLFEIVYYLQDKKHSTATELATHFEVSKRTILRDIETLSMAGIPIYTTQGRGGGIFILDNYVLDKTILSDEQQNQILIGLQSLAAAENINVDKILSKLKTFFNKADADWIEVDFSRWGNTALDKEKFEILKNSIISNREVSFDYAGMSGEITHRTIYPLKMIFKSKAWYLYAYCLTKKDYRIFKINRMISVKSSPNDFDSTSFNVPPLETSEPYYTNIHVKLRFSSHAAYRVYDEFNESDIIRNKDGTLTVHAEMPQDSWLYGFLLSFGDSVEVLEPEILRENLLDKINSIRKLYSPPIN